MHIASNPVDAHLALLQAHKEENCYVYVSKTDILFCHIFLMIGIPKGLFID